MSDAFDVYADYLGAGVPGPELRETAASRIQAQAHYGNPHSQHALGLQSRADLDAARASMLTYFDAWADYEVVFTSGATAAIRTAAEIFSTLRTPVSATATAATSADRPARHRLAYLAHWASHTSVIGVRAHPHVARFSGFRNAGDAVVSLGASQPHAVDGRFPLLSDILSELSRASDDAGGASAEPEAETEAGAASAATAALVAMPLECNFSGARYTIDQVASIAAQQRRGRSATATDTAAAALPVYFLVDAAAACGKVPIRLDGTGIDALAMSVYKMSGLPFGLGALLVRREHVDRDRADRTLVCGRAYFGGGTVDGLSMTSGFASLRSGAAAWEDGTPNVGALQLVPAALRQVGLRAASPASAAALPSGSPPDDGGDAGATAAAPTSPAAPATIWDGIARRAASVDILRQRLVAELAALRHHNGAPCVRFLTAYFGGGSGVDDDGDDASLQRRWQHQGATVTFVVVTDTGAPVGHQLVEENRSMRLLRAKRQQGLEGVIQIGVGPGAVLRLLCRHRRRELR